jgi:hypothetical protein
MKGQKRQTKGQAANTRTFIAVVSVCLVLETSLLQQLLLWRDPVLNESVGEACKCHQAAQTAGWT